MGLKNFFNFQITIEIPGRGNVQEGLIKKSDTAFPGRSGVDIQTMHLNGA